ncbi:unnamed protein product, partial [Rotaria sp. Silwood1]
VMTNEQVALFVSQKASNTSLENIASQLLDKRLIPALPDIIQYPKKSLAAFVILACDGIWDVMTNEQVALFVSQKASNTSLENIASQLLDQCLKLKTSDNMSIYIIKVL